MVGILSKSLPGEVFLIRFWAGKIKNTFAVTELDKARTSTQKVR
jgi:hypothetical protein